MSMMMPLSVKSKSSTVIEDDAPVDHLSASSLDSVEVDDGDVEAEVEDLVGDEIEAYASKMSVDEAMDVLKGEDGVPDTAQLLLIIGQSKEFNEFLARHHPGVWKRIKGQLKSPKFWAGMVPGVNLAVIGKSIRHAYRKKKAAKGMHGVDATLDHMMDVSQSHQKQKLVQSSIQMGVGVTTTALGPAGLTVGAALTPMMGLGSGLVGTAVSSGITTTVNTGVGQGLQSGGYALAADDLGHVDEEVGDGSMSDYKTNRALLHFLGYGPRRTPEELAVHGIEPEQEAARLLLKEQMGFDVESDLVGRDKEVRSRGRFLPKRHDWLTKTEREWYTKLKNGDVTMAGIPKEHRLAMAWKLEKVFDMDGAMTEEAVQAIMGLPDPPKHAPVPKPEDVPSLSSMDLEDLKKWYALEMLPSPPGHEDDDVEPDTLASMSRALKLEQDLPDVPDTPIEPSFEARLARLKSGLAHESTPTLMERLKALNDGDPIVPDPELEAMELEARGKQLADDIDVDRTALDDLELQVRMARLQGDDDDPGLARVSELLLALQKLPDPPKMTIEQLLDTI